MAIRSRRWRFAASTAGDRESSGDDAAQLAQRWSAWFEREFPAEDQRRFLGIVDTEIKRLGKPIDDFLDLQRLEAGRLDYHFETRSLRPLIEEAVGMFEQGMDDETLKKLFTRFYRADSTATRRIGGTGLGLALVKEIVEAHGGQVGVSSLPAKGIELWFALPLAGGGD